MRKIIFILFLLPLMLLGQDADSLKLALKNAKHDTTRCAVFILLAENSEQEEKLVYYSKIKGIVMKNLSKDPKLKVIYTKYLAHVSIGEADLFFRTGRVQRAIELYYQGLKFYEEINDKVGIAESYNNIAQVYAYQDQISSAVNYLEKSLTIYKYLSDTSSIAMVLNNLGNAYYHLKRDDLAIKYLSESYKLSKLVGLTEGVASSLINLAYIFENQKKYQLSLEYFQESLKIRQENGDKKGISASLVHVAEAYYYLGKYQISEQYAKKGLILAEELGYPDYIGDAAGLLKSIDRKQNKFKEAFEMYELEVQMRDSINNEQTQKAAVRKQLQYTYEKKEAVAQAEHKVELEKQQAIADEKQRKQNIVIWSVVLGLILVIAFAAYVFKTLSVTRKQKLVIEIKSKEVEEKQREILDSIHYAKRIQQALIPSDKYIEKNLNRLRKM